MTAPSVQPENYRVYRVLNSMCYLGLPAHAAFIPLFFWLGVPKLALFNFFSVAAWLVAFFLNRQGRHSAAINLVTIEVIAHAALATYYLGWGSGFQTYLMPMVTFTMINTRMRTRTMLLQAVGVLALYTGLFVVTKQHPPQVSAQFVETAHYLNIVVVFSALAIISYFFRRASAEAERRMEELASTDMLTHLPNRRRMREIMENELSRFERTGHPFAVILTDVDFFKKLNDAYGHDCGDFVLRTIASRLRGAVRSHDSVGRWGGEEFLALLPETNIEAALDAAERMRHAIELETICFCGHDLNVTMTFGVAICVAGENIEAVITRADMALYQGKHQGRNRVSTIVEESEAARG